MNYRIYKMKAKLLNASSSKYNILHYFYYRIILICVEYINLYTFLNNSLNVIYGIFLFLIFIFF